MKETEAFLTTGSGAGVHQHSTQYAGTGCERDGSVGVVALLMLDRSPAKWFFSYFSCWWCWWCGQGARMAGQHREHTHRIACLVLLLTHARQRWRSQQVPRRHLHLGACCCPSHARQAAWVRAWARGVSASTPFPRAGVLVRPRLSAAA
jgi:hypothetical protein